MEIRHPDAKINKYPGKCIILGEHLHVLLSVEIKTRTLPSPPPKKNQNQTQSLKPFHIQNSPTTKMVTDMVLIFFNHLFLGEWVGANFLERVQDINSNEILRNKP